MQILFKTISKQLSKSYIFYDKSMLKWHTNTIKQPYHLYQYKNLKSFLITNKYCEIIIEKSY